MHETVAAALIAAAVSLLVSLLTARYERRKLESEEKRQERELMRRLTEKMLDLRLKAYPLAFRITDKLTGHILYRKTESVTPAYIRAVLEELLEWHRSKAGFLLTRSSIRTYRALRDALNAEPTDSTYSRGQLDAMFRGKNELRGALKSDLSLLYKEDLPAVEHVGVPSAQIPVAPET